VFLPAIPQFNGQKSVWSIISQFLNPIVNEMFTTLRVSPSGDIMPTLIARQLPFTSGMLSDQYHPKEMIVSDDKHKRHKAVKNGDGASPQFQTRKLNFTRFTELPRWTVSPILIKSVDLGRSDALRFNFVHVVAEAGLGDKNKTAQISRDPPIRDDLDIDRSGLRPYMVSVNCAPSDATLRRAGEWSYLISDIVMGQQMTITGSLDLVGVQSPICIGDNIEYDNHVLHIESVTHSFSVNMANGMTTFSTSLGLTHGMTSAQLNGTDFSLFSGLDSEDLRTLESKKTREYSQNPEEPDSQGENLDPGREIPPTVSTGRA
jgi:hypothetical protein